MLKKRAEDRKDVGAAISPMLKEEWDRHKSRYATRWLSAMAARGAFRYVHEPWADVADYRDAVDAQSDTARRELIRDEHVVALAMQTSQRVLSQDRRQARYLRALLSHPSTPEALSGLHWVAPDLPRAIDWIGEGMPDDDSMKLEG